MWRNLVFLNTFQICNCSNYRFHSTYEPISWVSSNTSSSDDTAKNDLYWINIFLLFNGMSVLLWRSIGYRNLKTGGADPEPIRVFLEGRIRIRFFYGRNRVRFFLGGWIRINNTRIRHHALIYLNDISIILAFTSKEKNYTVEFRLDPNKGFSSRVKSRSGFFFEGRNQIHFLWRPDPVFS